MLSLNRDVTHNFRSALLPGYVVQAKFCKVLAYLLSSIFYPLSDIEAHGMPIAEMGFEGAQCRVSSDDSLDLAARALP